MTTTRHHLSDAGQFYVGLVATAGLAIVLHSLYVLSVGTIGYQWFVLAGLTLLSGSFTIRIPTIPARLSVSETFVFAAAILFGPAAATVIVVLDTLIISLWLRRASRQPLRVLFNMAAPAIAIWVAAHTFFYLADIQPLYITQRPILSLVGHILVLALLYFLLNSWLIAAAVGFEKRVPPFVIWRENFLWLSLNYFSGASVAALLLPYLQDEQRPFIRIAGFLLPLLLISYLTFKTALGRVEDANRHLSELNRLYLSTIETLAMAIDAKDQITHGHIRRVQQYAVELAKRVGITDVGQLRAIEAASLLHDMGKLAVPEYILNKPGKLTPAEFEKMKVHASVGADILSAINFPYPVVPIVRHHHENWDGTGYPDGIGGGDIPIGARILSVVDCFDALTSDRPYRPRLSDAEAIKILLQRRGSMYDPLVVDTFIKMQENTGSQLDNACSDMQHLSAIGRESRSLQTPDAGSGLDDITASTEEMLMLFDLAKNLTGQLRFSEAAEAVSKHLRRLVPASTCVFFTYDVVADDLVVAHAAGEHSGQFQGLRIPRGQRLTGWVAANRQSILNSDPMLDLGEVARSLKPRLYSCLSIPLIHEGSLTGAITLYSSQKDAFTEDHRRVSEAVAKQAALALTLAAAEPLSTADVIAKFRPNDGDLKPIDEFVTDKSASTFSIAFLRFDAVRSGRSAEPDEEGFYQIVKEMRKALRDADVLFRYGRTEIVALLGQTSSEAANNVGQRMAETLRELKHSSRERGLGTIAAVVGVATAPKDGTSIETLISSAKKRSKSIDDFTVERPSIH